MCTADPAGVITVTADAVLWSYASAVTVNVPPDVLPDLLACAALVQRMETALDEVVGWARVDACAIPRVTRTRSTDVIVTVRSDELAPD